MFTWYVMLILDVIVVIATFVVHSLACQMHVAAVDAIQDKQQRAKRQRVGYYYCKLMSAPLHALNK
jgi:hypothetical protein